MNKTTYSLEDVESAFDDLGRIALTAGKVVDIAVYGGVAMMLTFPARAATRDVDAVAMGNPDFLREAARQVARERGWPESWLNDAVKGFLSTRKSDQDVLVLFRTYPSEQEVGLRVFVARPEYLLAMKCLAMRIDTLGESRDLDDIKALINSLSLTSVQQVLSIVSDYYPNQRILPKTQFGIEELMGRIGLASGGQSND